MRELFKTHFALTDKGAKDLQKASAASFFVYVINFFPAMLLLLLVDELLLNNVKEMGLYLWGSVLVLAAMWILLRIEYDALYNTTYQESANLRTEIADILTKLPLSYFSRHDLSDLAQTIMADVAAIEHAMSHAMAKAVGFLFFFPLLSVLLLLGNVKLGLAIILPILLGFGLLLLSKNLQIRESFKHYQKLRDNSESFQEAIENHQQEFLFYVKNYFVTTWRQYIYLAALLIGGAGLIGYRKRLKEEGRSYLAVGFFLWALMPILWFSIAATKLIWYSYATLIPILIGAGIVAGTAVRDRNISAGLRTAAFVGVLVLTGYFIAGNVQNIRAEYGNDFHDFFAEANEAASDYAGTQMYLGADGDFGYGNWSQNTSFLAEIDGDHVCMDGGVEAFVQTKEPAVLVTNRDYYAQYADVLMDKTVVYENEKYLYMSNDL